MKNKKLIITLVIFVAVQAIAGVLYNRLGDMLQPQGLATATEPVPETTEATAPEETEEYRAKAVDFTVKNFDGEDVKLSDYFGKPIVLNFWAYWCGPCQSEMPEFNARYEQLGGEVTFLMVHADPDTTQGKSLVVAEGYSFPVVYDESGEAAANYGISAYPTTFFIDAQGYLQAYYVGAMDGELLQQGIDLIYTPAG